jgi:hypothetical protein
MRHAAFAAVLALSSAPAFAAGSPELTYTGAAELKAAAAQVPAVGESRAAGASDVITEPHILLQAGKTVLFGHADTAEQAAAAAAYWTPLLTAQGIAVGTLEYKSGIFTLPYTTSDGRVLRHFLADARQFPPKDPAGLRANMAASLSGLTAAGLTPVSARVVNLEFLLPTYSVLYLTKADANPDREANIRVLQGKEDMDVSLFAGGGVTVLQQPKPWLMVYIGPRAGHVAMVAKTPEEAAKKLAARREFLEKNGHRILGEKTSPIDFEGYKLLLELYFVADGGSASAAAAPAPTPVQLAKATLCTLRAIEGDDCVYACRDGREYRSPVRQPDPWRPNEPVLACPQVVFPF